MLTTLVICVVSLGAISLMGRRVRIPEPVFLGEDGFGSGSDLVTC
jgi:hypothetical protein